MNTLPDPSSSSGASADQDSVLSAGLAALKQGNPTEAIRLLESLTNAQSLQRTGWLNQSAGLKAQMGLVVAYDRQGEAAKALSLCRQLEQSSNSQARDWANRMRTNLTKRQAQAESRSSASSVIVDATGFVPLDSTAKLQSDHSLAGQPSGFVPLNPASAEMAAVPPETALKQPVIPEEPAADLLMGRAATPADADQEIPVEVTSQAAATPIDLPLTPSPTDPRLEPPAPDSSSLESIGYQPGWRQAERARRWQPLKTLNSIHLWLLQFASAIILFLGLRWLLGWLQTGTEAILSQFPFWQPSYNPSDSLSYVLILIMVVATVASPWLLDGLFGYCYGLKSFPTSALGQYSPEAERLIQRFCQQQRLPKLTLKILPTPTPIALTYGFIPRTARVVVSQGLLDQLTEDEVAAIYASELGHLVLWDYLLLSLLTLLLQIPYLIYWKAAQWGDRRSNLVLQTGAAVVSAGGYGLYWFMRWSGLCLSRWRLYESDRLGTELTGNPNALTRALMKLAIGIATDVQKQKQTRDLLESLDLITPVGVKTALSLGSAWSHAPLEPMLGWDRIHPHRRWLALNNAHPLMGDRLEKLDAYARRWNLGTQLNLTAIPQPKPRWGMLLLQAAPYLGLPLGWGIGQVLWWVSWLLGRLEVNQPSINAMIPRLVWFYGDQSLLSSCLLITFGLSIILRFNRFFPDLKSSQLQTETPGISLPTLLSDANALPLDSQPVALTGQLLGRRGMSNWLGQDLLLQTSTGLVKLHYLSSLGVMGNLFQRHRPVSLIGQTILVKGWYRRGATPWIDADLLQATVSRRTIRGGHQTWSTLLAMTAIALGIYILLKGG